MCPLMQITCGYKLCFLWTGYTGQLPVCKVEVGEPSLKKLNYCNSHEEQVMLCGNNNVFLFQIFL